MVDPERESSVARRGFSVANLLSAFRFPLAVLFPFTGGGGRLAVLVAAAASDQIDGRLARRTGTVTRLGEVLDPIADKTFMLSALSTLAVEGILPWWALPALLTRDIGVAIGVLLLALQGTRVRMPARRAGKLVTLLQFAGIGGMLAWPETASWLAVLTAAAGMYALGDYARAVRRAVA